MWLHIFLVSFSLCYAHNIQKRSCCSTDGDCRDGCCVGIGKLSLCHSYSKEGESCTFNSRIGCGCRPGLRCAKSGVLSWTCMKKKDLRPCCNECGNPKVQGPRVIAGENAIPGSWPWQVLLFYNGQAGCGGTLIAPQWVVTAAHCVYGNEKYPSWFKIRVGEHDISRDDESEVDIPVERIFRHQHYIHWLMQNDIALLKLKRPVTFNKYVSPVCLPSGDPPPGTECYITGWGKTWVLGSMTDILQQAKLPVVDSKVCNKKNLPSLGVHITDAMICGGDGGKTRRSACHGDSGGPYVCHISGRWELHGAVSYGSRFCSSSEAYTVFTRVNHFRSWIESTMTLT